MVSQSEGGSSEPSGRSAAEVPANCTDAGGSGYGTCGDWRDDLRAEYGECGVPPASAAADASLSLPARLAVFGDCQDCKVFIGAALCASAAACLLTVLICLAVGQPEPGWIEFLSALLFCLSALWLYTLITQAATIRDYQKQNEALVQQVDDLAQVKSRLEQFSKEFGGNIAEAKNFLGNLNAATTVNVKHAILNYLRVDGLRKPGRLNQAQSLDLYNGCLVHLWSDNPYFKQCREGLIEWLSQGVDVDVVIDLAMRTARDASELQWCTRQHRPATAAQLRPPSRRSRDHEWHAHGGHHGDHHGGHHGDHPEPLEELR
eukprot:TRINITY_DN16689_c0_g1_i1.p1 TRINITY_DN16689_c0_g1~~TRINITY_DN16689_c0_g1_i1.p1  ORF type:complete len:318 (+),score=48.26 TRINITY_DN16689_c0_g1_i1:100-1053(+)